MQETAKLFGLAFGVLFLCALIGGIGTTLLLHTSFSDTFLRTLYLGFFGACLANPLAWIGAAVPVVLAYLWTEKTLRPAAE